jgi:hypothetical protein
VALSVFKNGWSTVMVQSVFPSVIKKQKRKYHQQEEEEEAGYNPWRLGKTGLFVFSWLNFVNLVIIPMICEVIVAPNCFLYAFRNPEPIVSSFTAFNSVVLPTIGSTIITIVNNLRESFEFHPPFQYSYQCTSSIMNSFVPPFLYAYIQSVFLLFAIKIASIILEKYDLQLLPEVFVPSQLTYYIEEKRSADQLRAPLEKYEEDVSNCLQRYHLKNAEREERDKFIAFDMDTFILDLCSDFSVLLTFGLVFPLLGGVIILRISLYVYLHEQFLLKLWKDLKIDGENSDVFVGVNPSASAPPDPHNQIERGTFQGIVPVDESEIDEEVEYVKTLDVSPIETFDASPVLTTVQPTSYTRETSQPNLRKLEYYQAFLKDCTGFLDSLLFSFRFLPFRASFFLCVFLFDIIGDSVPDYTTAVWAIPVFIGSVLVGGFSAKWLSKLCGVSIGAAPSYDKIDGSGEIGFEGAEVNL